MRSVQVSLGPATMEAKWATPLLGGSDLGKQTLCQLSLLPLAEQG